MKEIAENKLLTLQADRLNFLKNLNILRHENFHYLRERKLSIAKQEEEANMVQKLKDIRKKNTRNVTSLLTRK